MFILSFTSISLFVCLAAILIVVFGQNRKYTSSAKISILSGAYLRIIAIFTVLASLMPCINLSYYSRMMLISLGILIWWMTTRNNYYIFVATTLRKFGIK